MPRSSTAVRALAYHSSLISLLTWQLCMCLFGSRVQAWAKSPLHPRGLFRTDVGTRIANSTFDYIVVGGGNAGLTIASRLSEQPSVRVAVVEAGDFYETTTGNQSQIPANDAYYNGKDPEDTGPGDWGFTTTPQAGIDNEVVHYARGKTLGGCSALNYMAYQRVPIGSLARWADDVGDTSYAYENVSRYYHKSLNFTPPDQSKRIANATPEYDLSTLGIGGPLDLGYPNYAQAFSTWVAKAMEKVGILPIKGFTSGSLNGSSWLLNTINHTTGIRESSETAFLRPALDRANLVVYPNTLAEKVLFRGNVAKGVRVASGNHSYTLSATKEVIVSAGTFQSPQLLQVSGVGPADLLDQHGIDVVANRPGVGQDMNDHIFYGITYRVNVQTATALSYGQGLQRAIEEFNNEQSGPLSSPGGDYAAYEKVPSGLRSKFSYSALQDLATYPDDWPELEYFTLPAYVGDFQFPPKGAPVDGYQYATITATPIVPMSRGNVSISSPSMRDQPLINPNWLTSPTDVEVAIAGFKRLRQIFEMPVLRANVTIGPEYFPGANVTTDDQILANIKRTFNTMYHASSTCRMGKPDDEWAVVDSKCRVYGVRNLRVVDASAFPFLPPGLPMGTVYMLAEKIADDIVNGD